MPIYDDLVERMRAVLDEAGVIREVRMFGGLCFMLNGNMVAAASMRGLRPRRQRPTVEDIGATRRKAHGNGGTTNGRLRPCRVLRLMTTDPCGTGLNRPLPS